MKLRIKGRYDSNLLYLHTLGTKQKSFEACYFENQVNIVDENADGISEPNQTSTQLSSLRFEVNIGVTYQYFLTSGDEHKF